MSKELSTLLDGYTRKLLLAHDDRGTEEDQDESAAAFVAINAAIAKLEEEAAIGRPILKLVRQEGFFRLETQAYGQQVWVITSAKDPKKYEAFDTERGRDLLTVVNKVAGLAEGVEV